VICDALVTLTLETVTTLPSGVVTVAFVAGQTAVAAAVVVSPVPLMVMEVGVPDGQTFGEMEVMVGMMHPILTVPCGSWLQPSQVRLRASVSVGAAVPTATVNPIWVALIYAPLDGVIQGTLSN
jgi:hypothetical protein